MKTDKHVFDYVNIVINALLYVQCVQDNVIHRLRRKEHMKLSHVTFCKNINTNVVYEITVLS